MQQRYKLHKNHKNYLSNMLQAFFQDENLQKGSTALQNIYWNCLRWLVELEFIQLEKQRKRLSFIILAKI